MRVLNVILAAAALGLVLGCAVGRLDYTKRKTAVCEVHHQKMLKTVVQVHYGLMDVTPRDSALQAASASGFPHAEDFINPGCMVHSQREALVYTCPECVKARRQWEANYHSKK